MVSPNWRIDLPKKRGLRYRLPRSVGKRLVWRNFFLEYERRGERIRQLENTNFDLVQQIFHNSLLRLSSYPAAVRFTLKVEGAPYAFNPSLAMVEGGFLSLVRDTNMTVVSDGQSYFYTTNPHRTENYIIDLSSDLSMQAWRKFDFGPHPPVGEAAANGIEDVRLFTINGKLQGLGVGIKDVSGGSREITQILLTLDPAGHVLDSKALKSPFGYAVEKNWMPFEHNSELHIVYSVDPLIIYRMHDDAFVCLPGKATSDHVSNHNMRYSGSTNGIPFRGGYLFVIHNRRRYLEKVSYVHYFLYLDKELRIIQISEPFLFDRAGIEFAVNMLEVSDRILISYGVADRRSRIISLPAVDIGDLVGIS